MLRAFVPSWQIVFLKAKLSKTLSFAKKLNLHFIMVSHDCILIVYDSELLKITFPAGTFVLTLFSE